MDNLDMEEKIKKYCTIEKSCKTFFDVKKESFCSKGLIRKRLERNILEKENPSVKVSYNLEKKKADIKKILLNYMSQNFEYIDNFDPEFVYENQDKFAELISNSDLDKYDKRRLISRIRKITNKIKYNEINKG